jgi:hypothetical protein
VARLSKENSESSSYCAHHWSTHFVHGLPASLQRNEPSHPLQKQLCVTQLPDACTDPTGGAVKDAARASVTVMAAMPSSLEVVVMEIWSFQVVVEKAGGTGFRPEV